MKNNQERGGEGGLIRGRELNRGFTVHIFINIFYTYIFLIGHSRNTCNKTFVLLNAIALSFHFSNYCRFEPFFKHSGYG